jgi:uncharacterized phage-like protein YoqJ
MKLAITGHRPDKLTRGSNETSFAIMKSYRVLSQYSEIESVYIGMAPGADLLAAKAAHLMGIPFVAVVPWKTHGLSIDSSWQSDYESALEFADYVEVLSDSETYPGPWVYHNRNRFMVDHADETLAVWDGRIDQGGGTLATVNYTRIKNKPLHVLDPKTLELELAPTEKV